MAPSIQIHCVCGGFGFPTGTASTKRVMLMGRALHSEGVPFHVWHLSPSSYSENTRKHGVYRMGSRGNILAHRFGRPANQWVRAFYFIYGCLLLPFRLARLRRDICVYTYYQGDMIDLWVLLVCRLGRPGMLRVVAWEDARRGLWFNRWMYHGVMFHWSTGALPISTLIEERIHKLQRRA